MRLLFVRDYTEAALPETQFSRFPGGLVLLPLAYFRSLSVLFATTSYVSPIPTILTACARDFFLCLFVSFSYKKLWITAGKPHFFGDGKDRGIAPRKKRRKKRIETWVPQTMKPTSVRSRQSDTVESVGI